MDLLLKIKDIATWGDLAGKVANASWIGTLLNAINWVLWIALILVGACGAVYAVYVGVKMARADSSEQREESKKRLINIIVSIVVTIALILFFNIVLPVILNEFHVLDGLVDSSELEPGSPSLEEGGRVIVNAARVLLGR